MFEVPKPIKEVFNAFPVYSYSSIPNTTEANNESIESSKFYFRTNKEKSSSEACFILGVHNVLMIKVGTGEKYTPSDPVSLGHALILCFKNDLKLPSPSGHGNKSSHSIMKLSYHASPDNQLPILIEDNSSLKTRNIRSSVSMNQSVKINNDFAKNALAQMVNELIDSEFYDLWILCLLGDLPKSNVLAFNQIFKLNTEITNSDTTNKLTIMSILNEIPNWGSFKVRYSYLFDHSKGRNLMNIPGRLQNEGLVEIFANTNNESIEKAYQDKLQQFESNLELLIDYVQNDTNNQKKILELKLIAFVINACTLLESTKLNEVVSKEKFAPFVKYCYEIISKY